MDLTERRLYKRMFFSMETGPVAVFTIPGMQGKTVSAIVMDLSVGGLGLSIRKEETTAIKINDRMKLKEIKGERNLRFVSDLEVYVRWLQNYKSFKHILFGCEFADPSQTVKNQVQEFINSWIKH